MISRAEGILSATDGAHLFVECKCGLVHHIGALAVRNVLAQTSPVIVRAFEAPAASAIVSQGCAGPSLTVEGPGECPRQAHEIVPAVLHHRSAQLPFAVAVQHFGSVEHFGQAIPELRLWEKEKRAQGQWS